MGATGKREDHTLGNISLLADYMEQAEVRMLTDYGLFIPIKEDSVFESFPTQQVSVFNMGATELSADGLVYPLSAFTNWWQGTFNAFLGITRKIERACFIPCRKACFYTYVRMELHIRMCKAAHTSVKAHTY